LVSLKPPITWENARWSQIPQYAPKDVKIFPGAALDCFCKEPPGPDHPLLRMPQVIVASHMGAHTDEAVNAMGRMSLDACLAVLRGERPAHIVNPQVYKKRRLVTK
jgi:D-3-phosphoglycerate dehydrogenase